MYNYTPMIFTLVLGEYLPVVFVYGMGGDETEFDNMRRVVEEMYPGIYTTSKRIGHGSVSSIDWPMDK